MGFVRQLQLLDETHYAQDRFDYSFAIKKLGNLISSAPNFAIICLVGPYGAGKSTALNQLKPHSDDKIWFEFDAWKYPDRKDLWENFVLELARQFDETTFKKIEQTIDGTQKSDAKTLLKVVSSGLNLAIPGAAIIGSLEHFLQTSPATRTYQLQKILTKLVKDKLQGKEALIVLEDIDRSGEAGIFFLETLKSYLKTLGVPGVRITCVVPIAQEKYYEHIDSYLKCTDVTEHFHTPPPVLGEYLDELLDNGIVTDLGKAQITQFCELLFTQYRDQMSPRKLKYILRAANSKYESMELDGLKPDPRVAIAVEASHYISQDASTDEKLFEQFLNDRSIHEQPFATFMMAIVKRCRLDQVKPGQVSHFLLDSRINSPIEDDPRCKPWDNGVVINGTSYHLHGFYFDY